MLTWLWPLRLGRASHKPDLSVSITSLQILKTSFTVNVVQLSQYFEVQFFYSVEARAENSRLLYPQYMWTIAR